jgi:phosphoglycerol transferase MdoB-like AlkP superfamily enzyme
MKKILAPTRFAFVKYIAFVALAISFFTRIVLAILSFNAAQYSLGQLLGAFFIGFFYDALCVSFLITPFVLHIWGTNNFLYKRPLFYVITFLFISFAAILWAGYIIPSAIDGTFRKAVCALFSLKVLCFVISGFLHTTQRLVFRKIVLYIYFAFCIFLLLLNAASEIVFWNEFGVRYNFIAVDYLVYTTEVLGNIWESYPIGYMLLGLFAITFLIFWFFKKGLKQSVSIGQKFIKRSYIAAAIFIFAFVQYFFINNSFKNFSENSFANELAGNGLYSFGAAYISNELDFDKFYKTLPLPEAYALVKKEMANKNTQFSFADSLTIERKITDSQPAKNYNIVLISIESLSADFMARYGNTQNITPGLDSLAKHSLVFENLFANGTRTVRGLEALSLSIPPVPGQSIVKRPPGTNENLFSLGHVLKSKGYTTQYIYGGYGYFDNMNYFFGHNSYDVIDRNAIPENEVHYSNIWGVADEDLFTLSLKTLDANHAKGKPFFSHIMTVSNHRPFTYPDGRIDIPSQNQVREGGVKYTDYAITKFINEAKEKPWFKNTIFVFVSDHCASSSGKEDLPINRYHIPCIVYAPSILPPGTNNTLMAQIDIAPTLLGMMHQSYTSKFFGTDVLQNASKNPHSFISNYQSLGFIQNNNLIIQKPLKTVNGYTIDFEKLQTSKTNLNDSVAKLAMAYYQVACDMVKMKKNKGN